MPTCRKCGVIFPNLNVIEGKQRNLCSRKFCLICSPWGLHNTKPVLGRVAENPQSIGCALCGREKKNKSRRLCGSCSTLVRRIRCKAAAIFYLGGKCVKCGWKGNLAGFHFHHRKPSEKEFHVGSGNRKWITLKVELDKCDLLCAICHTILHSQRLLNPRVLDEVLRYQTDHLKGVRETIKSYLMGA